MEIELTVEDKEGKRTVVRGKAPSKLALLPLFYRLRKYANKDHKLISVYCDDLQFLGLIAQAVASDVITTAIKLEGDA